MIPEVAAADTLWALVLAFIARHATTKRIRKLVLLVLAYVVCEALFHQAMENWAANALF
jgi:hypothetical protein